MAQMCGATAIKYYLPTNFLALGLGQELSLLASGIESTLKIACTIMAMVLIDWHGRRKTLILGAIVMSFALLVYFHHPISVFQQL
jgi:MFS family permease